MPLYDAYSPFKGTPRMCRENLDSSLQGGFPPLSPGPDIPRGRTTAAYPLLCKGFFQGFRDDLGLCNDLGFYKLGLWGSCLKGDSYNKWNPIGKDHGK